MNNDAIKSIKVLVNATNVDIRDMGIEAAIRATLKAGSTELPEEIADLFKLSIIDVNGELRARVEMA